MKGACSLAFNDMRSEADMRKIADEFDLKLSEDYSKEFRELQDEIYDLKAKLSRLKAKLSRLKAKLSRYEQPDNPNYTDDEMDAMSALNDLVHDSNADVQNECNCVG